MNLTMRWVGYDERPRVALAREQCYAMAGKEHGRYLELIDSDDRARPGDYLLAEHEGGAVGTATSYSMSMWVRGGRIPCQAVAWVGAIKVEMLPVLMERLQAGCRPFGTTPGATSN